MFNEKNSIEEQSFFLDFNFEKEYIRGHTKIKLRLENPELNPEKILTIHFCAKQICIQDVQCLDFSFYDENKNEIQRGDNANDLFYLKWQYPDIMTQVRNISFKFIV